MKREQIQEEKKQLTKRRKTRKELTNYMKTVVIGLGSIGCVHMQVLRALKKEVVAVCDINEEKANLFSEIPFLSIIKILYLLYKTLITYQLLYQLLLRVV